MADRCDNRLPRYESGQHLSQYSVNPAHEYQPDDEHQQRQGNAGAVLGHRLTEQMKLVNEVFHNHEWLAPFGIANAHGAQACWP